jgi:hypothetical protein
MVRTLLTLAAVAVPHIEGALLHPSEGRMFLDHLRCNVDDRKAEGMEAHDRAKQALEDVS